MSLLVQNLKPLEKDLGRDLWRRVWELWSSNHRSLKSMIEDFIVDYPKTCRRIIQKEVSWIASDYLGYDVSIKHCSISDLDLSAGGVCKKYNLKVSYRFNLKRYHDYSTKYAGRKLHRCDSRIDMKGDKSFEHFAKSMNDLGITCYLNDFIHIKLSRKGFLTDPCEDLIDCDLEGRYNTADFVHYVSWHMLFTSTIRAETVLCSEGIPFYVDSEENDIFSLPDGSFKNILMRSVVEELGKSMSREWKEKLKIWSKYDLEGASVSIMECYDGINVSTDDLSRRLLIHRRCKVDLELAIKEMNVVRAYRYFSHS